MKIHPMRVLVDMLNQEHVNKKLNRGPYRYCDEINMIQELKHVKYTASQYYGNMGQVKENNIMVKDKIFGNLIEKTLKELNLEFVVELI